MFVPTISGTLSLRSDFGTTNIGIQIRPITDNCSFSSDISDKVVVCQRVVSVKGGGRQDISVRICNITAKSVVIKPKSVFCELREGQ
jgi:hypothetical protein